MLFHQCISNLGGHSRPQRLRGARGQPAFSTLHHTHKQAEPAAKHLHQRPVIIVAAGAVNSGGGSGKAKKSAKLCLHEGCTKHAT